MRSQPAPGKVYLVGAGPGDPGLITLRGVQCLGRGDLVLYDYLVNERILQHASEDAELVCLGRHGRDRIWTQDEINERMIAAAKSGQYVVRLKGGDVTIFAHQAEETAALAAAGVQYELVPGVTAALAAGCYLDLPLTHREHSSAVAIVTGQQKAADDNSPAAPLDYASLAKFPGTLVFYMGVTTAPQWTAALIAAGKSPETPAMIVRRCTWPDQRAIRCTLREIPIYLGSGKRELRPPVIAIVGEAVAHAQAESWFTSRPLFGQRVLVTRPLDQADTLVNLLEGQGADVLVNPAIEIGPPDDWAPVDAAIATLSSFDWLVFSSANGVRRFLDRVEAGGDMRQLSGVKIACIGPGTAAYLARYRLRVDLQAPEFRAESLVESLLPHVMGKSCLLVRASRGREVLAEQLAAAGALVSQVVAYSSRDISVNPSIAQEMSAGRISWVTVTSSAIAKSVFAQFGESLQNARIASISPITTATLAECGLRPAVEATQYTMPGLVEAMMRSS